MNDVYQNFIGLEGYLGLMARYLTPFIWDKYSIIVMPPSYPMDGLAHP